MENLQYKNRKKLQEIIGGQVCDHSTAVSEADMIFLGVKPYLLAELIQGILPAFSQRSPAPVVVSMAAGKTVAEVLPHTGQKALSSGKKFPQLLHFFMLVAFSIPKPQTHPRFAPALILSFFDWRQRYFIIKQQKKQPFLKNKNVRFFCILQKKGSSQIFV